MSFKCKVNKTRSGAFEHTSLTPTISQTDIKMTVVEAQVSGESPEVLKQLVYMARGTEDLVWNDR